MMCSCPKCNASVETDLVHIPLDGATVPCPECKSRFWTGRESFARRALRKQGKVYCGKCSSELGHSIVCLSCGHMYPDHYLVQASKPPRRKIEKTGFSLSFSLAPARQKTSGYSSTYTQTLGTKAHKTHRAATPGKLLAIVISLILIATLTIVGTNAYRNYTAEQKYAANFARVLYILKTGTDACYATCAKISADWKVKSDAGQRFSPRLSAEDESRLNRIKDEIGLVMQRLDKPPQKFSKTNEALAKLYGIHLRLNSLLVSPPSSLPAFTDSVNKVAGDFKTASQELKTGLPPELSEELEKAKKKYRGLQDF